MINKKQKLQLLKQAVIHMKNQLTEITENNTQQATYKKQTKKQSNKKELQHADTERTLSNNKIHLSPTKQRQSKKQLQSKESKESIMHHPQKIKVIMDSVDKHYYQSKSTMDYPQNFGKSTSRTKKPHMQSLITLTSLTDRKYYQSVNSQFSEKENEECQRQTDIKSKNNLLLQQRNRIKIFSLPFSDPILYPRQEKQSGKKIVKKVQKSPSSFLVSHPNCNDNLKFYGNVGIVSQSKGNIAHDRNRSLIFQRVSPIYEGRSCSKRHFGRYFEQQFSSCI